MLIAEKTGLIDRIYKRNDKEKDKDKRFKIIEGPNHEIELKPYVDTNLYKD